MEAPGKGGAAATTGEMLDNPVIGAASIPIPPDHALVRHGLNILAREIRETDISQEEREAVLGYVDSNVSGVFHRKSGPLSIITDEIYIGNHIAAQSRRMRDSVGIRSVLSVNEKPMNIQLGDTLTRAEQIPLIDGAGNDPGAFQRAVSILKTLVTDHSPVLVHCHAGRSRSPLVVAQHLYNSGVCLSSREALDFIANRRDVEITDGREEVLS